MTARVNDLLEYARTQLGGEMPIARSQVDVKEICQAAINDVSAAHPDCPFDMAASGNLLGNFDGTRLHQVFSNLLNNAAQYCGKEDPVVVSINGRPHVMVVEVQNLVPLQ